MNQTDIHSIDNLATVSMELSSKCNLKCKMCSHPTNPRPITTMSFENFKTIIDKLLKTNIRNLFLNMGEPFMNKSLFMMISYAKRNGFSVFISTNGQLLNESHMANCIKSGLDMIKFSIEGYTPETYHSIRIGGSFDQIVHNVKKMKEMRDSAGTLPRIRISTILMKDNRDIVDFVKSWGPFCDEIEYTTITNHIGIVDNREIALSPTWNLRRGCPQIKPYREINVLSNGDMVICCVDFHGRCILGNLLKQDLEEIWTSNKMKEIREKAHSDNMQDLEPCRECFIADYSEILPETMRDAITLMHDFIKNNMWDIIEHVKYDNNPDARCMMCQKPINISFAGLCIRCIEKKITG